jgi:hypothetical protein
VRLKLDNVFKMPDKVSDTEYILKKCKDIISIVIRIVVLMSSLLAVN